MKKAEAKLLPSQHVNKCWITSGWTGTCLFKNYPVSFIPPYLAEISFVKELKQFSVLFFSTVEKAFQPVDKISSGNRLPFAKNR